MTAWEHLSLAVRLCGAAGPAQGSSGAGAGKGAGQLASGSAEQQAQALAELVSLPGSMFQVGWGSG